MERALEHFFERGSVVRHEEILRYSLERGTGSVTFAEVAGAVQNLVERKRLLAVGEGRANSRGVFRSTSVGDWWLGEEGRSERTRDFPSPGA